MPIQIHTKTGRETELWKILDAWKKVYPAKFRFFKTSLQRMRQVQKAPDGSWVDKKGRRTEVRFRAPTELWLFIQRWIPGFGNTSDDIDLLLKTAGDFFASAPRHSKKIYSVKDQTKKSERKPDEDKRSDDSARLRDFDPRHDPKSPRGEPAAG
jgi:hypothetical protein